MRVKQTFRPKFSSHRSYGVQRCYAMTYCIRIYDRHVMSPGTNGLEVLISIAHMHVEKLCTLIFIPIGNIIDLMFQSQRIESSTLRSSKVNISQNNDGWDKRCRCQHRKLHVTFRLAYLHLTLTYSEGQGQGQGREHFNYENL